MRAPGFRVAEKSVLVCGPTCFPGKRGKADMNCVLIFLYENF